MAASTSETPRSLPTVYESYPYISRERFAGKLNGKVAIVTGTSVGIGRETAKSFASAGAKTACVARREADLNSLVEEIKKAGGHAIAVVADVAEPGAAQRIVGKVEEELGPVDILVNNAAISRIGPVEAEAEDMAKWWRVLEVNVKAPVALSRAVLPGMLKRNSGSIITVTSGVLSMSLPVMSAYSSSKAAITKFHQALGIELQGTGVTTVSVNPGFIATELGKPEDAINRDAMDHPLTKAFMSSISNGSFKHTDIDVPANYMVALAADERCKVLQGMYVSATAPLEAILEEAEKEGKGRIGKEKMYVINMPEL
ncbi:hypothetical protein BAUCODRAFT_35087 [Baudoinia panamericana UAMH 10762]|uniref:Uncharacterized protein n=1 Tax=Baudoinia panamericana (strain UAMH 10762) TaxID=717646 RepID=M2MU62_BAUPA|nr:uncharacterized protein BAUCODRAFT_35087 [Baudoinia panamericana UAMH 10762]EMC95098.1 hypothetical protein BAUCODRAFT_35087 [Baudoinia panamericana UAMH 10762]